VRHGASTRDAAGRPVSPLVIGDGAMRPNLGPPRPPPRVHRQLLLGPSPNLSRVNPARAAIAAPKGQRLPDRCSRLHSAHQNAFRSFGNQLLEQAQAALPPPPSAEGMTTCHPSRLSVLPGSRSRAVGLVSRTRGAGERRGRSQVVNSRKVCLCGAPAPRRCSRYSRRLLCVLITVYFVTSAAGGEGRGLRPCGVVGRGTIGWWTVRQSGWWLA
jgi:hypothetical protein